MSADEFQPRSMTPGNNILIALALISCLVIPTESKGGKTGGKRKKNNEPSSTIPKRPSGTSSVAASTSPGKRPPSSEFKDLEALWHQPLVLHGELKTVRESTHEERLLDFLFDEQEYKPVARAVMNTSKTVTVSIDFVLLRIHGLDERLQILTTTGLVIAEWTDDRLIWDPKDFGDLTNIIVTADKIWLPELAVMNGADELMPDFDRIRVLLHSDGRLHWEPGGIFRTTCDIDIAYFPFDSQICQLLIGAYSYHSTRMNITNASSAISTHDFRINGEWHVASTSAHWDITVLQTPGESRTSDARFSQHQLVDANITAALNDSETVNYTDWSPTPVAVDGYSHVIFTLNLKRRYKYYIMNIVLPCVMLSVLIMIGFCLSPDAGEKISLGISVLLAFTVFLLMITEWIPRTSLAVPLIVTYLMTTMTLGTVSVCMTVLVLNAHHRGPTCRDVPPWIRQFVLIYLARLIRYQTTQLSLASSSSKSRRQRSRRPPRNNFRSPKNSPQKSSFSFHNSPTAASNSAAHHRCPDSDIWQRQCRYSYLDPDGTAPSLLEPSTAKDGICSVTLPDGGSNHVDDPQQTRINNGLLTRTTEPTSISRIPPPSGSSVDIAASHRHHTGFRSMAFTCQLRRKLQRSKPTSSPSSSWTRFTPHSIADSSRGKLVGLRLSHFGTTGSSDDSPSGAVTASGSELDNERNNWAAAAAAAASKRFQAARCIDSDPDDCTADEDEERHTDDVLDDSPIAKNISAVEGNGGNRKSRGGDGAVDGVEEWHEVARVLDRAFFWLLFGLMTFSGGAILLYPKYSGYDDSWG